MIEGRAARSAGLIAASHRRGGASKTLLPPGEGGRRPDERVPLEGAPSVSTQSASLEVQHRQQGSLTPALSRREREKSAIPSQHPLHQHQCQPAVEFLPHLRHPPHFDKAEPPMQFEAGFVVGFDAGDDDVYAGLPGFVQ